jgi:hypothetical protein
MIHEGNALMEMTLLELVGTFTNASVFVANPETEAELARRQRMLDAAEGMAKILRMVLERDGYIGVAEVLTAYQAAKETL